MSVLEQTKLETSHDHSIPVTCRTLSTIKHFTKQSVQIVVYNSLIYCTGPPNVFAREDHISFCTAVRGPDILRNVIVSK